ncbi:TLDc domain [Dillenia turbinata]|uniref:TLDc domain n=1 Tax=Dillenia turbinata TaxID=194707 RepID=A0AAN8UPF6_9MAGN
MNSWKDKVSDKIFGLFADSPSSGPHLDNGSPKYNARSHEEGKPWSSLVSLLIPSAGSDGLTQDKHRHMKSFHSLPLRRESHDLDLEDDLKFEECLPVCENKEVVSRDEDQCPGSGRSTDSSDVFEEANCHDLHKPMPNLIDESSFISAELYEFFQSSLPNIVKGCQWILLYSTLKHGISLQTLIRKSAELSGPCLLIVGDMQGAVFGGLLECPLKPTAKRKYQGTNQTFVFTTIYGEPRLFRATGANRYFYMCLNDLLALGGGSNFALCLDGDLLCGSSGPCETFGNLCLAHSTEFELKNVENKFEQQ